MAYPPPLKVELHAHSSLDPRDGVRHSTAALIDRAAALGYHALAVTCHDRYFEPGADDLAQARAGGLLLIRGVERTVRGSHVLLINFPAACLDVRTFDDIAPLKRAHPDGLVIAPHPLYPTPSAMGFAALQRHAALFDAVEVNALYTRRIDFNARAAAWARAHDKPLVGNSDVHTLAQIGTTFSLVDSAPHPDAICAAIRQGRVKVVTRPLSMIEAGRNFSGMLRSGAAGFLRRAAVNRTQ